MAREIIIDPVTRIEGHAKITLVLDDAGAVSDARFHVTEFRGFEKFCQGRFFREMPAITARVCGICPVSHLVASAKTGDALLAVSIPPTAEKLRRIANLAQWVQSHALSFFHLSAADLFLGHETPAAERNLFGLMRARPELARQGIRLRQFGQQVIEALGGRRIHATWICPGGVTAPLDAAARTTLRGQLREMFGIADGAIAELKGLWSSLADEIATCGEFPSLFMGLVTPEGTLEPYDGRLRIVDAERHMVADQLEPADYRQFLGEAQEDWSYLKFPYYRPLGYPAGMYRVGPLARLNVAERCGTPRADAELVEFRALSRGAVTSSFHYHYARLIEILYALERIGELLAEEAILDEHVLAKAELNARHAVGCSEAPRGTLFHEYHVNDAGLLEQVNLLIATGQNNLAMNRTIRQIAARYVEGPTISDAALNRVEAGIRAYDPCLSCSTHAVGRMPLAIEFVDVAGQRLGESRRGSDG